MVTGTRLILGRHVGGSGYKDDTAGSRIWAHRLGLRSVLRFLQGQHRTDCMKIVMKDTTITMKNVLTRCKYLWTTKLLSILRRGVQLDIIHSSSLELPHSAVLFHVAGPGGKDGVEDEGFGQVGGGRAGGDDRHAGGRWSRGAGICRSPDTRPRSARASLSLLYYIPRGTTGAHDGRHRVSS